MKYLILITKILCLTLCIICLLAGSSTANDGFQIEVRGVRIIDVGYQNENENIMPFNQFAGTSISCLLLSKTEGIINFVDIKSNLKEFKDNLGTNLLDSEANFGNGFGLMREISKDRSALLFEISGSRLPNKKATSLVGVGEIVVKTANKSNVFRVNDLIPKKGSSIETPFGKIEIRHIGKTNWGEHPNKISFESSVNLSVIKNIKFTDKTGSTIDSKSMGIHMSSKCQDNHV